ncbi:class I SAM-dependent methyltransferase [Brytella acorum]|uniref:Class I SAM-dependent methyltransferase n=1 Tax=Brytella acorum TaxID=2959299 RepID=A0AA35XWQ7_9PROT|nr:class I SAM-dependent methyltransferase [Brytella acorum]MDF3624298.1 class I SAM-dependent methyltransferase [Brytella acorum]CAI9121128.1 class I SAM-dependent methyltransferase [Brytella acorum]
MFQAPDASAVFDTFKNRSDEDWLSILVSSLQIPEIDGAHMPRFPPDDLQREIHGHSGEVSLHEAHVFYREIKAYCSYVGRPVMPETRVLDFGCGWGRVTRLFMKDVRPDNLFGVDSTSRFLIEARRCNPALNFLSCQLVPPLLMGDGTFDLITSWSVFSHLDEFLAGHWIREFHRLLRPGGIAILTTQSRRFIGFCAEMRARRASGMRLEHGWYEACADSFTDEAHANSRYEAGMFLHAASVQAPHPQAHYGEAIIPRNYVVKQWGSLFRLVEFLDNPVRLPQVMIVLQKI